MKVNNATQRGSEELRIGSIVHHKNLKYTLQARDETLGYCFWKVEKPGEDGFGAFLTNSYTPLSFHEGVFVNSLSMNSTWAVGVQI